MKGFFIHEMATSHLQTRLVFRARFQKRSARDRLRNNNVILIGRSFSTNADHDRLIWLRKCETKQFIVNWIMTQIIHWEIWNWNYVVLIEWKTSDWWYLFMTSQWEVWRCHLCVPIRECHGQFSARTQCLHTIQHGLDMPYLTGMCMWLTSLKMYKLLTQDRPCSSKWFSVVCGV